MMVFHIVNALFLISNVILVPLRPSKPLKELEPFQELVKIIEGNQDKNSHSVPLPEDKNSMPKITPPVPSSVTDDDDDNIGNNPSIPNKNAVPGIPNKVDGPLASTSSIIPLENSPLPLPAEECHTEQGEIGECLSAFDCGATNGEISGLCHMGLDSSQYLRVCCKYESQCGFHTSKSVSNFKNPSYPDYTENHSDCQLEVDINPGVCQLRLDFLDFHLGNMVNGECQENNKLEIVTTVPHAYIPTKVLCGKIMDNSSLEGHDYLKTDLPHMYIHLHDPEDHIENRVPNVATPAVRLVIKVHNHASRWNIRVTQVQCDGAPLQAPSGCAQYYNAFSGTMTSLNMFDQQYQRNLDLDACIRLDQKACAIKYDVEMLSVGENLEKKLKYGLLCDDFVSFHGEKTGMCGTLDGREIVLPATGFQGMFMHTNDVSGANEAGFKVHYRYIRDCEDLTFFQYPVLK